MGKLRGFINSQGWWLRWVIVMGSVLLVVSVVNASSPARDIRFQSPLPTSPLPSPTPFVVTVCPVCYEATVTPSPTPMATPTPTSTPVPTPVCYVEDLLTMDQLRAVVNDVTDGDQRIEYYTYVIGMAVKAVRPECFGLMP